MLALGIGKSLCTNPLSEVPVPALLLELCESKSSCVEIRMHTPIRRSQRFCRLVLFFNGGI